jgi:hypothetical protein
MLVSTIPSKIILLLDKFRTNNSIGFILNMVDHNKRLIGTLLPKDLIPKTNFYFHYYYKVKGDKARIYPTSVIKNFTYKLFNNEKFVGDSQVYYKIDSVLKLIPLNFSPIIREYLADGLTKNTSKLLQNNIQSILDDNMELMNHKEARLKDKIFIYFKSYVLVIKARRYQMTNKIKPFVLNWLVFIILYPITKTYYFFKK